MRFLKTSFSLFLIGSIVVSGLALFSISSAQGAGIKFTSCTVGGILANQFQKQIEDWVTELGKEIGLGFLFGGGAGIGGSVPVVDEKFISTWARKESRADIIARCTAREIFNTMSKGIVNNARTAGRNGGPVFVRNWRNFQTDAQYRGEGVFRAMLSNTKLCDYFSSDFKGLFGATTPTAVPKNTRTGNLDPYALRANCTMPSGFNLTNYQNNFSGNGGWQAFSRMLEPQNNYYGALFGALAESAKQKGLEESADINQAIAGKGLLGTSGTNANDSCKIKDRNGKCLEYKDIKTPGSIIGDSVAATFQQELAWITNVDELGEVISAATEVLLKRLFDFSDPNEGDYTVYVPPVISESPEPSPGPVTSWVWQDNGGPSYVSTKCPNTDPRSYFFSLVQGRGPENWEQVLNEIEPNLWACGIGQQRDSSGNVRGRLYLPTATCPDAEPDPADARLGVKQDPVCWEHSVDVTGSGGGGGGETQPPEQVF